MLSTRNSTTSPGSRTTLLYTDADLERLRDDVRTYGFSCLPDALSPPVLDALQHEAESRLDLARSAEQVSALSYRAKISSLGPAASSLLGGPDARDLLYSVFEEQLMLAEGVSCLTFYGEGDHLGAHLDEPASECAVTILVYLTASGAASPPSPATGL